MKRHFPDRGGWALTALCAATLGGYGAPGYGAPSLSAPDAPGTVVTAPEPPAPAPVVLRKATVSVDGQEREYLVYAPKAVNALRENDARRVRIVISLHDDGQDGQANAERTRWSEIAEAHGFIAVFPNAAEKRWNTAPAAGGADEIAFIRAMAAAVRTRYGLTATVPTYLTGTGAGGTLAQQLAMLAPDLATAVAGIQGVAPGATYELLRQRPPSAMAAWLWRAPGAGLSLDEIKQIAYWTTANAAQDTAVVAHTAQAETSTYAQAGNPVQQVKVSRLREGQAGDSQAVSQLIWSEMFDKTIRFADAKTTNGTLHANETIESMGLLESTKEWRPGQPRRWLTYVPSNYAELTANGRKVPLIFSFHGRNGSARFQALITEWHKVAEARGFIVVYPQGIGATWEVAMDPNARDVRFFLDLLAETKARYAIDTSRVFLNGSSMGTALTNRIAVQYPELFAAIAPCYSGHLHAAHYAHPIVKTHVPLPVWQCRGGDELPSEFRGGTAGETAARHFWRETVNRNTGPFTLQVDGRRRTEIWNDGVAEYRWQLTDGVGHFWHPGQALKMWDEMLSKYQRAPDGNLIRH